MDNINNINFQARLDLSRVSKDKERWNNIAKVFEKGTTGYPKQILEVGDDTGYPKPILNMWNDAITENKDIFTAFTTGPKNDGSGEIEVQFSKDLYKRLMKLSDERVAAKLKKILKMSFKMDKFFCAFEKFEKKLADDEKVWNPFHDALDAQIDIEIDKIAKPDRILKDAKII